MVNVPFVNGRAPAAVRRPVVAIATPSGEEVWQRHTLDIAVQTGPLPFVNTARITYAAGAPDLALQDAVTLSLGYADAEPSPVLTGIVTRQVRPLTGSRHLHLSDGGALLARQRLNQSYESQDAGAIVADLASQAGVTTGPLEAGIALPFFALASQTPAHAQIAALARRSGYWAYFTPDGALTFAPPTGNTVQTFTYGRDVLQLQASEAPPSLDGVQVSGEGAAGSQGQDAWNWLVADAAGVQAQAGDGAAQRWVADGSLRSQEAVRQAATAYAATAAAHQLTADLWVPGAPRVTVGSQVAITAAPEEFLNGPYQVQRVCHRLSKQHGFVTRLSVLKPASGPLGALAGLSGGLL